jgi:hypothetical protein
MSFDQISLQLPRSRIIKYILVCNTGFLLSSHVLCKGSTDFLFSVKPFSILTFALVKEPARANESELAKLVVEIVSKFENSFVSVLRRLVFPSELACETAHCLEEAPIVVFRCHVSYNKDIMIRKLF